MAFSNPIVCGRRICGRCGRWRLQTDYKWRWQTRRYGTTKKRYKKPTIDSVCIPCRRAIERERYHKLTPEQKKVRGRVANQQARIRRDKLNEQIARVKMIRAQRVPQWDDKTVDIVPFRMWIIGQARMDPRGASGLADQIGTHEKNVRRWLNGYDWDYEVGQSWAGCEPKPIHTVTVGVVDKVGNALGQPDLLDRLYPFVDRED